MATQAYRYEPPHRAEQRRRAAAAAVSKLPELTLAFWVMKISATTLGETAGDMFSMTFKLGYALTSIVLVSAFVVVLIAQLRSKRYHPPLYWGVILATSTAGTTMSDMMDRTLGLGYVRGSAVLVTLLLIVLAIWRFSTGTIAVSDVQSRKSETFYWMAILVSNTLGTALGDFFSTSSGLGFALSAGLIGATIAVIVLLHYFTSFSPVALFWAAFVLTRPFGATFGDLLTKPHEKGGFGIGTIWSSVFLVVVLVGMVWWARKQQLDVVPQVDPLAPETRRTREAVKEGR